LREVYSRDAPDTVFDGYPLRAGYRISGLILDNYIFGKIPIK
jgi:hypothetical protein